MASNLKKLKNEYAKLAKKYSLPKFEDLNKKFEIERAAERETEMLLREIRRVMVDKASNYFKFIELFINPQTAPLFFLAVIKRVNGIERKSLEEIYTELGKLEIDSIALENIYEEKKEAEFIKKLDKKWFEITKKFSEIVEKLKKSAEEESEKKEKSYFG